MSGGLGGYQINPTSGMGETLGQGPAGQQEPLGKRLAEVLEILSQCHGQLNEVEDRMGITRLPEKAGQKDPGPTGVNGLAMYLRTSALTLRQRLEGHVSSL